VILRPLELGADVVLYSATKYLGGHNDVMAGAVTVADPALGERLQYRLNTTGATLGPFDSFLLLRGLKTLSLRMERHESNARAVADFLRAAPQVSRVLYPGRSGMISFDLADGVDIAANARSWGLDVLEVHTIAEFKEAYRKAEASDRPTMIHIETDLYGPNPPGSSWWDVPVSGVSELESTQRAYEEYLRDRKPQRHYL